MSNMSEKITVMLADDSSVIRSALSRMLKTDPNIEVIASVPDGKAAISMARLKKPDLVILDVEMPVMDGITALPEILKLSPKTKVIMCSSLTAKGADTSIKAMSLGAVECLVKPSGAEASQPNSPFKIKLLKTIKTLAPKKPNNLSLLSQSRPSAATSIAKIEQDKKIILRDDKNAYKGKPYIIAIGSSTGGPKALFKVLKDIGKLDIPIVITQHMPETFTKILAEHITQQTGIPAHEADEGMIVENGNIYVARGGKHMLFENSSAQLKIRLNDGPQENFCKPAVDPMMRSLVDIYGNKVLGIILTGMGSDGAKGSQYLVDKGGRVIAQNEETCVVWGMPKAVAEAGICSAILPLQDIGAWVRKTCM